jgi:hypothetical protein
MLMTISISEEEKKIITELATKYNRSISNYLVYASMEWDKLQKV